MMKLVSISAIAVMAWASTAQAGDMSASDFVGKASMSNLFEIESSKLAMERATDPKVKEFASRMVKDHTKAGEDLKAALAESGLNIQPTMALNDKYREKLEEIREEDGDDFDEEYVEIQEKAHDRTVRLFEKYAEKGDNEALRQFASKTLPTLKQHESHSNDLEDEIDGLW